MTLLRKSLKLTALSSLIAMAFCARTATAAAITWTGATATWNTAGNWTGTNTPPITGDSVIFGAAGAGGTTLNNNLTASGFNLAGITFNAGASAYTITGNTFTLTGNIVNNSTSLQTLGMPMSIGASRVITAGGDITLTSAITGTAGLTLTKNGAGKLTLGVANTFAGSTVVAMGSGTATANQGILRVEHSNAFGTNSLTINNAFVNNAGSAILELANNITIPATTVMNVSGRNPAGSTNPFLRNVSGNNTFSGNITITAGGGGYGVNLVAGTLTLGGTITNNVAASNRPFEFFGAGNVVVGGATNDTGTGLFSLIFSNTGTSTLQQPASAFSGGVSLNNASGTLNINTATSLGSGLFTIAGGTINSTAAFTNQTITTNPTQRWNGNFAFTGTNNLNLGTGAVTLGTTAGTSRTLTVNASTLTVGGVISDGTTANALVKEGTGTLTLTGNNNYTGTTTVNAGTLQIGNGGTSGEFGDGDVINNSIVSFNRTNSASFANNISGTGVLNQNGTGITALSGTNSYQGGTNVNTGTLTYLNTAAQPGVGTTSVAAGTTLGLGVGGAGFYSSVDVDNLIANTMTNVTMNATAQVGIDTTAGDFTHSTTLTLPRSIVKLGANKLTLPGNNTFTGNVTSQAGLLEMSGANAFTGNLIAQGGNILMSGNNSFTGNVLASSGTITFSGTNTYSGSTTAAGGTIALTGGTNRLPTATAFSLGNNGTLDVGNTSQTLSNFSLPAATTVTGTITGTGGTLSLSQTTLNLGPSTNANQATINMAGLSNLIYNNSSGTFRVGPATSPGAVTTQVATVTLGSNNSITANLFAVADLNGSAGAGAATLNLGQTNTIHANNINVAYSGRSTGVLQFATGLTNPTVTIRGATGGTSSATTFNIGQVANNATPTWIATADFSAGNLDANVGSMIVGSADFAASTDRRGVVNASFTMGQGTMNVGTLTIGRLAGSTGSILGGATYGTSGTVTLNNAAGILNATTITLANNTIPATVGTGGGSVTRTLSSTVNLVDGTIRSTTIQLGAQTGATATVTTNFNWSGGTIENTPGANLTISSVPLTLLTSAAHNFNVTGSNTTTVAATSPISGVGFGITKLGTGTLELSATNSYTGTTTVNAGTLAVSSTGSLFNNGPDKVFVAAPDSIQDSNDPKILRNVASGTNYATAFPSGFGSTSVSAAPLTTGTTASILAGTSSASADVGMQWRTRLAPSETDGSDPNTPLSDVVNLTGMPNGDVYLMQMSYSQAALTALNLDETAIALSGELRLGWYDTNTNTWETAVAGNSSGSSHFVGIKSAADFLSTMTGSLTDNLGAYGVDPTGSGGTVWAILNHNSEFAVIPEPSTMVLGALAGLGFAAFRLRRRVRS